jgi:hypothetical protein
MVGNSVRRCAKITVLTRQPTRRRIVQLTFAYLVLGSWWVYAVVDRRGDVGSVWQLILLYAGHVLVGAIAGRWWVLPLPLLLIPIAIPAGHLPTSGDLDRVYEIPLLMAPGLVVILAIGVILRRVGRRLVHRTR